MRSMSPCIDSKESWWRSTLPCRSSTPEGMAMRFVSSRWLHSLAAQLLGTYVAGLILTTCCIGGAIWFGFSQNAGTTTQAQLDKGTDIIRRGIRFDSAGRPAAVVFFPSDL